MRLVITGHMISKRIHTYVETVASHHLKESKLTFKLKPQFEMSDELKVPLLYISVLIDTGR